MAAGVKLLREINFSTIHTYGQTASKHVNNDDEHHSITFSFLIGCEICDVLADIADMIENFKIDELI